MWGHFRPFVVALLLTALVDGACDLPSFAGPSPSIRPACVPPPSPTTGVAPSSRIPQIRISGIVRSRETCAPIEGVGVAAYEAHGDAVTLGSRVVTISDSGGLFALEVVPGKYRLLFDPPQGSEFGSRWWPKESSYLYATSIDGDRADIVMLLPRGISISGRVITDTGAPIPDAHVRVSLANNQYDFAAITFTDGSGRYSVMVAPGDYRLQFFASPLWASQWWDNRSSYGAADTVIASRDVTDISVMLRPGKTLRGRITSASSGTLAGVFVFAMLPSTKNWCCEFVGYAAVDANGLFRFSVPDGTYRIGFIFSDNDEHFTVLWWPKGSYDVDEAGPVLVDRDRSDINLALP